MKSNGQNSQGEFDFYERDILPKQERAHSDWLDGARAWALAYGADGRLVTVNDVRRGFGPPPIGKDPRVMGAIFTRDAWEMVRRDRTTRRICHNRPIAFFRRRTT